jgi:hypothetical protein
VAANLSRVGVSTHWVSLTCFMSFVLSFVIPHVLVAGAMTPLVVLATFECAAKSRIESAKARWTCAEQRDGGALPCVLFTCQVPLVFWRITATPPPSRVGRGRGRIISDDRWKSHIAFALIIVQIPR